MKTSEFRKLIREEAKKIINESQVQPGMDLGIFTIAIDKGNGESGFCSGDRWLEVSDRPQKFYDLKQAQKMVKTYSNWQSKVSTAKTTQDMAYAYARVRSDADIATKKQEVAACTWTIYKLALGSKL